MHKKSPRGNYKSPIEEVCQQVVALLAENTLRMKLHALEIEHAVANAHDLPLFAAGGHLKAFRQR